MIECGKATLVITPSLRRPVHRARIERRLGEQVIKRRAFSMSAPR